MTDAWLLWLFVACCLMASFCFSGIETGMLAINRVRLRALVRRKNRRAAIIARYLETPDHFLAATLVGNTIVNTTSAVLATHLLVQWTPRWGEWLAFVLLSSILYTICELVPKSLFRQFPTRLSVMMAGLTHAAFTVLKPLVVVFGWVTSALMGGFGNGKARVEFFVSREELKRLILDSDAGGHFTPEEKRMIQEVFNLRHITLQQIMTPWAQVATVSADASADQIVRASRDSGYSRLPVTETNGTTVGVVSVYDILFETAQFEGKTARQIVRRAHLFPAETSIDQGLQRLRATQQPLAVVVDKGQKTIGIVTIEDMLAKLIGEVEG